MKELNLLPIYRNGFGEISGGKDIPVPQFCKRNCLINEKCKNYYMKLEEEATGLYVCPYGFASYVFQIEEGNCIFTCLRIEGKYDRRKLLPKIQNEDKNYREITYSLLLTYVEVYKEYYKNQYQYEKYKKFIDDIFHDVRKFNQQIKAKNDRIYRKSQQNRRYAEISELSKAIQVMGWFLTLRLNNHDFLYNEEIMCADIPILYNMYRIIDKVRHCIKYRAEEKRIKIDLQAERSCRDIRAYDCIELLPFLVLDNAIKYSPDGEGIYILLEEKGNMQHIQFKSLGPIVDENELEFITQQGYRGENARRVTEDGMGIGLYTAKCICDLNNLEMKISSEKEIKKKKNDIAYSEFMVDFWVKL